MRREGSALRGVGVVMLKELADHFTSVLVVIMVVLVILFPAMVMHYKGVGTGVDPDKVKIEIPQLDLPPLDLNIK